MEKFLGIRPSGRDRVPSTVSISRDHTSSDVLVSERLGISDFMHISVDHAFERSQVDIVALYKV